MTAALMRVFLIVLTLSTAFFLTKFICFLKPIGATSLISLFLLTSGQLVLTVIVWFLVHFSYHFYYRNNRIDVYHRAVLVTGCDTGFGHKTAIKLDQLGFHVFAGVLDANGPGAEHLKASCSKQLKFVQMNVTDNKQIQKVVDQIKNSGFELWAVVNNAGTMFNSFIEFGHQIDDCQRLFDVNLFGPLRVAKACLPLLRKSKGRLINVTSTVAHVNFAMTGIYNMTKYAARAMTNALRDEVEPFGIKVIAIEPAGYKTGLIKELPNNFNRILNQTDPAVISEYNEVYGNLKKGFEKFCKLQWLVIKSDFSNVVDAIEKAVTCRKPKFCYRVTGLGLRLIVWLWSMLADEVTCWINWVVMSYAFKINKSR